MVDVVTELWIDRPLEDVARYAADPMHAPEWYANIRSAQWETEPDLRQGAKATFVAHFLGRTLTYTYEIVELVPDQRLVMRTSQGPFPMETTYSWAARDGGTQMTLRNRGRPRGFSAMVAPFMGRAMRRANRADLRRLKQVLEAV